MESVVVRKSSFYVVILFFYLFFFFFTVNCVSIAGMVFLGIQNRHFFYPPMLYSCIRMVYESGAGKGINTLHSINHCLILVICVCTVLSKNPIIKIKEYSGLTMMELPFPAVSFPIFRVISYMFKGHSRSI